MAIARYMMFRDSAGHLHYVTRINTRNAHEEEMGEEWAHAYCDACGRSVAAPLSECFDSSKS